MSEKRYCTYAHLHPETMKVRYVGLTGNLGRRYKQHCKHQPWIQELLQRGLEPIQRVLDTDMTLEQARKSEKYWVTHFESEGHLLENSNLIDSAIHWEIEEQGTLQRLRERFDYLPEDEALKMASTIYQAWKDNGPLCWEETFQDVLIAFRLLESTHKLSLSLSELDIISLTYQVIDKKLDEPSPQHWVEGKKK